MSRTGKPCSAGGARGPFHRDHHRAPAYLIGREADGDHRPIDRRPSLPPPAISGPQPAGPRSGAFPAGLHRPGCSQAIVTYCSKSGRENKSYVNVSRRSICRPELHVSAFTRGTRRGVDAVKVAGKERRSGDRSFNELWSARRHRLGAVGRRDVETTPAGCWPRMSDRPPPRHLARRRASPRSR
jgi:hypothetical protein